VKEQVRPMSAAVTVCGTFNLGLPAVTEAVESFQDAGLKVLSPADPTPVEIVDGFLYVASDRHRDPALVEAGHLRSIAQSRFVWLVAPDGYVGVMAALEIGFALACEVPVFTLDRVVDADIRTLVQRVPSVRAAVDRCRESLTTGSSASFLVSPDDAAEGAHASIDLLQSLLTTAQADTGPRAGAVARDLHHALAGLDSTP
jgi:hypothetical protein